MFLHLVRSRFTGILRDRTQLFWSAAFPLILMTIFMVVLIPLGEETGIAPDLPVAVVDNAVWREDATLRTVIAEAASDFNDEDAEPKLLSALVTDARDAEHRLQQGEVIAILTPKADHRLSVGVMNRGLETSIVRMFADQYTQTHHTVASVIRSHPERAAAVIERLDTFDADRYFANDSWADKGNSSATYFFALFGMVILFNMSFAMTEMNHLMANQSPQGARLHVAPVRRSTMILASLTVSFVIQYAVSWLLVLYMHFVIGIRVLDYAPQIALLLAAANLCSVALGLFVGAAFRSSKDLKIGIVIGVANFLAFLAGLMTPYVRIALRRHIPHLARLNPAELMADSFYSIYYFNSPGRLLANCAILAAIAGVMLLASVLILRRQNYDSI